MKLIKTSQKSIYYVQNKNSITYYFNYKEPLTQKSKRKKLFSKEKHLEKHLRQCIIQSEEIKKDLKNFNSSEVVEEIKYKNYYNLSKLGTLYFDYRYNKKVRMLKERYNHLNDEEFKENVLVKKKLYSIIREKRRFERHTKNTELSSISVNKITKNTINNYIENNLSLNLSQKSKSIIISIIKTIFSFSIQNDIINIKSPFEFINFKDDKRRRERVLSNEEIKLLLKECLKYDKNKNVYLSVLLGVLTGSRSNTVLNIKKSDIDINNKTISLYNFKTEKQFQIMLNDESVEYLKNEILNDRKTNEYLIKSFYNQENKIEQKQPLYYIPKKVYSIMDELFNKELNKKNNFDRDKVVNYHTLRRSIGTNLVREGTSVYNVMKFLNHSSIEQTMRYLNIENNEIHNDVVKLMNNIFK
ncbi:MAG: tyrosine-type recombinase/integrase [Arcobacter sp.]|uniref:tyrosine-type recombinase/integrase n=1 Tax=Arcobacter sp. TaxID=1872629 RepID=UPI003B004468